MLVRPWVGGCPAICQALLVAWSSAAVGAQICESSTTTSTAGEVSLTTRVQEEYFACADGEFLVAVDVSHHLNLGTTRWRCSDGEESTLFEPNSYDQSDTAVFDVAITEIEARAVVVDEVINTFLGDVYIKGYNKSSSSSSSSSTIFAEFGPFGAGNEYTEESMNSTCPTDSYATGVYFWYVVDPARWVFMMHLECAEAVGTCSPFSTDDLESDADNGEKKSSSSTRAALVGGCVGAAVLILAICVGVLLRLRLRRRDQPLKSPETFVTPEALVIQAPASRKPEGAMVTGGVSQTSALEPPPPGYQSPPPYSAVVEASRGTNEG